MIRLNKTLLDKLDADTLVPQYNRDKLKPGIVHLGIGAFHRAHQAFYTESVLNQLGGDWGIIGCSLRSANVRDQLVPQDCLYTLVERSNQGEKLQIIGAVVDTLVGPENPAAIIDAIAQSSIKILSMTITEKGYCHDPATGNLQLQHPDIIHDLQHLDKPVSAIGFIVAGLQKRFQNQQRAFTVLSCDNLPNNGEILERVVLQFAEKISPDLAKWIKSNATFPCSMIDRIAPATTEEDKQDLEKRLGFRDEGLVTCEPFSQWVIEDKFADGRPAWDKVGALMVEDVRIFEKIKLRLLNGAHSIMAYSGYLSGYSFISQVMENPAFVNMIKTYMAREAGETLIAPQGFNIEAYKQQLIDRFSNKALKHKTWQIAMDGSQKIPQRWLETLRQQLQTHQHNEIICLGLAAWIRYVSGIDEQQNPIEVSDPFAKELRAISDSYKADPVAAVRPMLSLQKIFGDDLQHQSQVIDSTTDWLSRFYQTGVRKSIEHHFN